MGVKSLLSREVLPKRTVPRELPCRKCGARNALPFVFCEECGHPRVKLGHWLVMGNISIAFSAFFATYYREEFFAWPWALYVLYGVFLLQLALMFVAESTFRALRFATWYVIFLAVGGLIYQELFTEGALFFVLVAKDLPELILDNPHIAYPIIGLVFAIGALPLYMRWVRLYGWVNAYRIVLLAATCLCAAPMLAFRIAAGLEASTLAEQFGEPLAKFVNEVAPQYAGILGFLSLRAIQLFFFEIFVFAAVRGYAVARQQKVKLNKKALDKESGFVRSVMSIAQVFWRFGQALDQMLQYLVQTLRELAVDLYQVIAAFLRELFIPAVSLAIASVLLLLLAQTTRAYIAENSLSRIGVMLGIIAALFVLEGVFLACKSRYAVQRVASVHLQFAGWLLPNFLVFFLLLSVSLYTTGVVLGGENGMGIELPFFLGMLTKAVGVLLLVAVAIIVSRKFALLRESGDEEEEEPQQQAQVPEDAAEEQRIDEAPAPADTPPAAATESEKRRRDWDLGQKKAAEDKKERKSKVAGLLNSAKSAIQRADMSNTARRALGDLQNKMSGKPEIVTRIEKLEKDMKERRDQIEALETTRGSISQETYVELVTKYKEELKNMEGDFARLHILISREYSESLVEVQKMQMKVDEVDRKIKEVETLHTAGGIPEKDYEVRHSMLLSQRQHEAKALEARQTRLSYFEPYVKKPSDPLSAPSSE